MSTTYVYVDESGQNDGRGDALHVGIVAVQAHAREELQQRLEAIELRLAKRSKWHGTSVKRKAEYLRAALLHDASPGVYWARCSERCDYEAATAAAAARAMQKIGSAHQFIVIIDGLKKTSRQRVAKVLRSHEIQWREIQVNKRDESDALLRLADSISGFMRDVHHRKDFTLDLWPEMANSLTEV